MPEAEATNQKRCNWIHLTLVVLGVVVLGVVVFIPLIYLGTAPFVVKALNPARQFAEEELLTKGVNFYLTPTQKACEVWPGYDQWAETIIGQK